MGSRRMLKFILTPSVTSIDTQDEPTFRAVGWQGKDLVVWAEATPYVPGSGEIDLPTGRTSTTSILTAIGTGEPVPERAEYVGSAAADINAFSVPIVMHVYRFLRG